MKNVLILSDNIQQINKLRRVFADDFKVSATNSMENALSILQNKSADLAVYHIGAGYGELFGFYKELRGNEKTEKLPLLVITDMSMLASLIDTVELKDGAFISSSITPENLNNLVNSFFNKEN